MLLCAVTVLCCRLPAGTSPDAVDYRVAAARAQPFYSAIRSYLPGLPEGALQPAYSGVRPKARRAAACLPAPWGACQAVQVLPAATAHRGICRLLAPTPPPLQVTGPGQPAGDFCIQGPQQHGVEGLVCL